MTNLIKVGSINKAKVAHQQAMTLPLVLVFMCVSHIIFMGSLHLTTLFQKQYLYQTAYYQAEIQYLIGQKLAQPPNQETIDEAFVDDVLIQLNDFKDQAIRRQGLLPLMNHPNTMDNSLAGLLVLQEDSHRVLTYQFQLFLDQEMSEQALVRSGLQTSGKLDPKDNYRMLRDPSYVNADYKIIEDSLLSLNYQMGKLFAFRQQYRWHPSSTPDLQLRFNTGELSIQNTSEQIHVQSQVDLADLTRSYTLTSPSRVYLLEWLGTEYTLPLNSPLSP